MTILLVINMLSFICGIALVLFAEYYSKKELKERSFMFGFGCSMIAIGVINIFALLIIMGA